MLKNKLKIIALLALGAASAGTAVADHERGRGARGRAPAEGWQYLAEVGTHRHDAEDYVAVPRARLDAIQLRASGGPVAIDGVRIKFTDGRSEFAEVNRRLRPGEAVQVNLPRNGERIEQLVLDYGNRGPYWRARETAHVQVLGLAADRRDHRDRDRDRFRDADRPWRTDGEYDGTRVEWRGGLRFEVK